MEKPDIKCLISGEQTEGKVAVYEELVPPGCGPPRHTHRDQLEVFHVIEGSIRFEVNGNSFEQRAGGTAVVPAGAVHAFRNIGAAPAVIRFELLPAGGSEEAFGLMVRGEVGDVGAFFEKYGMNLAGPPLV
jgi:quercetin dioxygenase-like cupin family protein